MDEGKKYAAIAVPQRENRPITGAAPLSGLGAVKAAPPNSVRFAEVEFSPGMNRTAVSAGAQRFALSATPSQPVKHEAADPVRLMLYEMRSLAKIRSLSRDNSELFYRQAKFMEGFSDDYEGDAKFSMHYPYYQQMGYEQLRTYFSWRKKVRLGDIQPTSVSYAFLYVYELLIGVGADNTMDGLEKLVAIWDKFLKFGPALSNYLPQWFKDYHIYYKLPHSFTDFVKKHSLHKYYPEMFLFHTDVDNSLEVWNCISGYSVTGSKFYKSGNEELMRDCFKYVLGGIRDLCESLGISCEEVFTYRYSRHGNWRPFKEALFYPWHRQRDRKVNMFGQERYQCKNNRWTALLPIYYSDQNRLVGNILKKMEACLRHTAKFKYHLKAEPTRFYRSSGTPIEFDGTIEKAVADFHSDLSRTVVIVDHENLARIRDEARGTQDKLLVPEEGTKLNPDLGDAEPKDAQGLLFEAEKPSPSVPILPPPSSAVELKDGWAALKNALTTTQRKALSIALHGGLGVKAFADENGIMLEVLADGINEKAADHIGDSILEIGDGATVYEEYREYIVEMVGEHG